MGLREKLLGGVADAVGYVPVVGDYLEGAVDELADPGSEHAEEAEAFRKAARQQFAGLEGQIPGQGQVPTGDIGPAPGGLYPGTGTAEQRYTIPALEREMARRERDSALAQQLTGGMASIADRMPGSGSRVARQAPAQNLEKQTKESLDQQIASYEPLRGTVIRESTPDQVTALEGAGADPLAVEAQRDVIGRLSSLVDSGGLSAIDRARIADTRAQADQYLRGQREATLANMEARGMRGSGAELMSQLAAQQAAGQRASTENMQTEAMAQSRAMQALGMLGGQAGQLRDQSYGEDFNRAQATDANTKWNQQMLQNWRDSQQREAWNRYNAQQGADWNRYRAHLDLAGRQAGFDQQAAGLAEGRRAEDRAETSALINAGASYLAGAPTNVAGGGAAPQPAQQPAWNPSTGTTPQFYTPQQQQSPAQPGQQTGPTFYTPGRRENR